MRNVVNVAATSIAGMTADDVDAITHRLTAADQARADAVRTVRQRQRFVVGRLLIHALAIRVAGPSASDIVVETDVSGRPHITGGAGGLFVSIAHSDDAVVAAVARRPVGIDIERATRTPRAGLAERVCSVDEWRRIDGLANDQRAAAILAIWVRKEAYGKARGTGLDFPLRAVTVDPSRPRIAGVDGVWLARGVEALPGYLTAVPARGQRWRLKLDVVGYRDL